MCFMCWINNIYCYFWKIPLILMQGSINALVFVGTSLQFVRFEWNHWYPCFGLLVISALGFKGIMDSSFVCCTSDSSLVWHLLSPLKTKHFYPCTCNVDVQALVTLYSNRLSHSGWARNFITITISWTSYHSHLDIKPDNASSALPGAWLGLHYKLFKFTAVIMYLTIFNLIWLYQERTVYWGSMNIWILSSAEAVGRLITVTGYVVIKWAQELHDKK